MESVESGSEQHVLIQVGLVQQAGIDPMSWFPPAEGGAGGPGVSVEPFATEVPEVPEFEKELPMLRAGGTGQGCTYIAMVEPAPYAALTWAGDGDGD